MKKLSDLGPGGGELCYEGTSVKLLTVAAKKDQDKVQKNMSKEIYNDQFFHGFTL